MNKALDKIKQAWDENPLAVIFVATLAATAAAKLLDASTARSNARTWAKEVDRRTMMKMR
jgi:hypothetical protein